MKVYVVVDGMYEDYHIKKVFLDKYKADNYVSLFKGEFTKPEVLEFDASDNEEFRFVTYIEVEFSSGKFRNNKDKFDFKLKSRELENYEDYVSFDYISFSHFKEIDLKNIHIRRIISKDYLEVTDEKKYEIEVEIEQECKDLFDEINALLDKGLNNKEINQWLSSEYVNSIK